MSIRLLAPLAALTILAGCSAVDTYGRERSDLHSGASQGRVDAARTRQSAAMQENVTLRARASQLEQEQRALDADVRGTEGQLRKLQTSIRSTKSATAAQQREYERLSAKHAQLKRELDRMAQAAPPTDEADAAERQLKLAQLRQERDTLQRQIEALGRAI